MRANKYKGMTDYGVKTQDIKDYAAEKGLDPDDVWKEVIDKFVENGATESEGYSLVDGVVSYREDWHEWCYVVVIEEGFQERDVTYHSDCVPNTLITVKDLLDGDEGIGKLLSAAEKQRKAGGIFVDAPTNAPINLPITVHISPQEVVKFLSDNYTMTFSFKRLNETSDKWKGFDGFSEDGVHLVQVYFKGD